MVGEDNSSLQVVSWLDVMVANHFLLFCIVNSHNDFVIMSAPQILSIIMIVLVLN